MASLNGYDATNGQTMDSRDVLPAGEYIAAIVKSERKDAKTPGNAYINLEFEVTDGPATGRRFWSMLNLWNNNAQAVEIAQRELNSICHAIGRLRIDDTEELHGVPLRVKLSVESNPQYGDQNRVKGYKPLNSSGALAPSGAAQAQQASGGSAPWNRRSA